jgi:hypothetical protein
MAKMLVGVGVFGVLRPSMMSAACVFRLFPSFAISSAVYSFVVACAK